MIAPLQVIEVPDILPNNLKKLRIMTNKTTNEIADAISLKNSYITTIENQKANMSGITAISIMVYLDVSFYQLFDIMKTIKLPYTTNDYENTVVRIIVDNKYLKNIDEKKDEKVNTNNMLYIHEEISKRLKLLNKEEGIKRFDLIETSPVDKNEDNLVVAAFDVVLLRKSIKEIEFDINFSAEMNYDLFEELTQKDFEEKKEITLNKGDFEIIEDKILITNYDNILKRGKFKNINETYDIKDDVKLCYDENKNLESIKINIGYEVKNHFKYIEKRLGMTPLDVQNALGVTQKSYYQIINGSSMLSTKMMWRLTKLFKVPLEVMFNVPYYLETHKRD